MNNENIEQTNGLIEKKRRGRPKGIISKSRGLKSILSDCDVVENDKKEVLTPFRNWLYGNLTVAQWIQFENFVKEQVDTPHKFNRLINNTDSWDLKALQLVYAWMVNNGFETIETYVLDWAIKYSINFRQLLLSEGMELIKWHEGELEKINKQ